jgi:hypothetical protein
MLQLLIQKRIFQEECLIPPKIASYGFPMLTKDAMLFLQLHMEEKYTKKWSLIYSSVTHGNSWQQFLSQITFPKTGSTLLIIEDKDKNQFGGFSSSPWALRPDFYGDASNFLFGIHPRTECYKAKTYNNHYQYLNSGTKSLPNGLGFGGQFDYFGLWIDSSFEVGHSKAAPLSSTYQSPRLSKQESFKIERVEVWCVLEIELDDSDLADKKSAMLANPDAMALLEMANRPSYHHYEDNPDE